MVKAKGLKEEANELLRDNNDDANMEEAIKLYFEAISLCPASEKKECAIFENNLAMAYKKMGKLEDAKEHFTKSIELNEEYPKPLFHRMNLYKLGGEYNNALNDANKIFEIDNKFQNISKIIPELEEIIEREQAGDEPEMNEE